ncbi:MFS transporter [bacterium]|nr:MFS transporter [bacterium]
MSLICGSNMSVYPAKTRWSWALYDWANSAFSTTVIAGFFPIFFKQYWHVDTDPIISTAHLGVANAIAGAIVACSAPLLGAMADYSGQKKRFLTLFMILGAGSTLSFAIIHQGQWMWAMGAFVVASIGFMSANVFYDAMLVDVAEPESRHQTSSWGYALGYLGGGLLLGVQIVLLQNPEWIGAQSSTDIVKLSFIMVGLWWAVFSIPLLITYKDKARQMAPGFICLVKQSWTQLVTTFKTLRHYRPACLFLVAYWCYIDGVHSVIRMAVDYGLSIGFTSQSMIGALLLVQFIAFPATLVFGKLSTKIGVKPCLYIGIIIYIIVICWAATVTSALAFYGCAVLIACGQGGIQALSRSYFATLVPAEKITEAFGFYNVVGKFSVIIGPLLLSGVAMGLHHLGVASNLASRMSLGSLILLFVIGGLLLMQVKKPQRFLNDK